MEKAFTHAEILKECGGPSPWYPLIYSQTQGVSREELYAITLDLQRLGLIQASDWVAGRGQGFILTEQGREKIKQPIATPVQEERKPQAIVGNTTYDRGERVRAAFLNHRPPVLTWLVMVVCLVWFVVGLILAIKRGTAFDFFLGRDPLSLTQTGAAWGFLIWTGQSWRLLTTMICHFGIIHLLLNMYGLFLVGSAAEQLWGRWRYFLIFFVSGLIGAMVTTAFRPNTLLAGASGAIWGVMASLAAWLLVFRQHLPKENVHKFGSNLFMAFAINTGTILIPNVAWEAHFAGGFAGFVVAIALAYVSSFKPLRSFVIFLLIGAMLTLSALGYRWQLNRAMTSIVSPVNLPMNMLQNMNQQKATPVIDLQAILQYFPVSQVVQIQNQGTLAAVANSRTKMKLVIQSADHLATESQNALAIVNQQLGQSTDEARILKLKKFERYFQLLNAYAEKAKNIAKETDNANGWKELNEQVNALKTMYEEINVVE